MADYRAWLKSALLAWRGAAAGGDGLVEERFHVFHAIWVLEVEVGGFAGVCFQVVELARRVRCGVGEDGLLGLDNYHILSTGFRRNFHINKLSSPYTAFDHSCVRGV